MSAWLNVNPAKLKGSVSNLEVHHFRQQFAVTLGAEFL